MLSIRRGVLARGACYNLSNIIMTISNLENGVFAVVLVTDSEQLSVLFARPEPQLDFGHELVGVERQSVLDVALWPEGGRYCGREAIGARPAGAALAPRFHHAAHARSVFRTPVADQLHAQVFGLRTSGNAVPGETGVGQIVELQTNRTTSVS